MVTQTLFVSASVLALACTFAERAAASCFAPIPDELLLPGVALGAANNEGIGPLRPGGLLWFETLDDGDTPGCDNLTVNRRIEGPAPNENVVGEPIAVELGVERP